jgi:methylsterol monooxygenase
MVRIALYPFFDQKNSLSIDFPWSLHNFVPFWSGAEHHDFHHMAFTNNYSTSFRWWDRIFGTDDKYRAYRKHLAAAKASMKSASKDDFKALEQRMLNEVEAEGLKAEAAVETGGKKATKVQ